MAVVPQQPSKLNRRRGAAGMLQRQPEAVCMLAHAVPASFLAAKAEAVSMRHQAVVSQSANSCSLKDRSG